MNKYGYCTDPWGCVVPHNDGGVPLSGTFDTVDLYPVADEDGRGGQEYPLPVLAPHPLPHSRILLTSPIHILKQNQFLATIFYRC